MRTLKRLCQTYTLQVFAPRTCMYWDGKLTLMQENLGGTNSGPGERTFTYLPVIANIGISEQ